ncbi:MAG: response regulator [Elusimicrobiales bacterium]
MKRIVVIDDDKNFTDTLRDLLKEKIKEDIEIYVFSNVKDAVIFLSGELVDLIILDVHFEGTHGFDFLDMLKKNPRLSAIPVIMVSARYTEPLDRIKAVNMGAVAYFSKPLDIDKLVKEIMNYVKK